MMYIFSKGVIYTTSDKYTHAMPWMHAQGTVPYHHLPLSVTIMFMCNEILEDY